MLYKERRRGKIPFLTRIVFSISKSFLIYTYLAIEDILQVPMDMYLLRLVSISLRKED